MNEIQARKLSAFVALGFILSCGPRNHAPDVPAIPVGPAYGLPDSVYAFSTSAFDPDGDSVALQVAWGYSPLSHWSGVIGSDGQAVWTRSWHGPGNYSVRVRARDTKGAVSDWSPALDVDILSPSALPVSPLPPVGPTSVLAGFIYEYTCVTRGPEGESLVVTIGWDDGSSEELPPITCIAGDTVRERLVSWEPGTKKPRVRVRDLASGRFSRWAEGAPVEAVEMTGRGWRRTYDGHRIKSVARALDGGLVVCMDRPQVARADSMGNLLWAGDYDSLMYEGMSVRQTSDAGYILLSCETGIWFPAGLDLARLDKNGNLRWHRQYRAGANGELGGMYGRVALPTPDNGYIVAGSTMLMKTDSCGDSLWAIECGADDVVLTADGNYMACGRGATLTKVTPLGQVLWLREVRPLYYSACAMQELADGGFVLGGRKWNSSDRDSAYVARTDAEGRLLWERFLPGLYDSELFDVAPASDGGFFLAGATAWDELGYLARLDARGNLAWQRVTELGCECLYALLPTADAGSIAGGGYWQGTFRGAALFRVDRNGGIGPINHEPGLPAGAGIRSKAQTAQRATAERPRAAMRGERGIR